jgi:hypothetical protein
MIIPRTPWCLFGNGTRGSRTSFSRDELQAIDAWPAGHVSEKENPCPEPPPPPPPPRDPSISTVHTEDLGTGISSRKMPKFSKPARIFRW